MSPGLGPQGGEAVDEPVLSVRGLWRSYQRGTGEEKTVLRGVDFDLEDSEITALLGRSGSGKSTLALCLAFLEVPDRGSVLLRGSAVDFSQRRLLVRARRKVQLVMQDPARSISPYFTVRQALIEPMIAGRESKEEQQDKIRRLLTQVGLPDSVLAMAARHLSGGQAQRLALARALATDPEVLILDESFSGLDLSLQARWVNLVLDLVESQGLTCLLITHDESLARQLAGRRVHLAEGQLVAEGQIVDEDRGAP